MLWIPITLAAAFLQNLRSALQKKLTDSLSTAGATYSRFLYGWPVALACLGILLTTGDAPLPQPGPAFFLFAFTGAVAQIAGTALLVSIFSLRTFAAGTAYSKTETVQTALIGTLVLGDRINAGGLFAIIISLAGVLLLSLPRKKKTMRTLLNGLVERTALMGLASGGAFGVAAVSYRAASLSLGLEGFALAAAFTLVWVLGIQTLTLSLWLYWRERGQILACFRQWKIAAPCGIAGGLASMGWFCAMTLQNAAYVKALGQVELLFTFAASAFFFREKNSRHEIAGALLITAGLAILVLFAYA